MRKEQKTTLCLKGNHYSITFIFFFLLIYFLVMSINVSLMYNNAATNYNYEFMNL